MKYDLDVKSFIFYFLKLYIYIYIITFFYILTIKKINTIIISVKGKTYQARVAQW